MTISMESARDFLSSCAQTSLNSLLLLNNREFARNVAYTVGAMGKLTGVADTNSAMKLCDVATSAINGSDWMKRTPADINKKIFKPFASFTPCNVTFAVRNSCFLLVEFLSFPLSVQELHLNPLFNKMIDSVRLSARAKALGETSVFQRVGQYNLSKFVLTLCATGHGINAAAKLLKLPRTIKGLRAKSWIVHASAIHSVLECTLSAAKLLVPNHNKAVAALTVLAKGTGAYFVYQQAIAKQKASEKVT